MLQNEISHQNHPRIKRPNKIQLLCKTSKQWKLPCIWGSFVVWPHHTLQSSSKKPPPTRGQVVSPGPSAGTRLIVADKVKVGKSPPHPPKACPRRFSTSVDWALMLARVVYPAKGFPQATFCLGSSPMSWFDGNKILQSLTGSNSWKVTRHSVTLTFPGCLYIWNGLPQAHFISFHFPQAYFHLFWRSFWGSPFEKFAFPSRILSSES